MAILPRGVTNAVSLSDSVPIDLVGVVVITAIGLATGLSPTPGPDWVRIGVGIGFVVLVPGYAFVALLFPRASDRRGLALRTANEITDGSGVVRITDIERLILSIGLSLLLVPLVGIGLSVTPWGTTATSIVVSLAALTIVFAVGAAIRRWALPENQRLRAPGAAWFASLVALPRNAPDSNRALIALLLVAGLLVAAGSVTGLAVHRGDGETFTEFSLQTYDRSAQAFTADGYPTEYVSGESSTVYLGVGNHEGRHVQYSVIVELHRLGANGEESDVLDSERIAVDELDVPAGETRRSRVTLDPTMTGENLRLTFLLYRGAPPETPTVENAYRNLHVWIDVQAPDGAR